METSVKTARQPVRQDFRVKRTEVMTIIFD